MTTNGHGASSSSSAAALEQQADELTSPAALRKLVLNYLVHHCYLDTAQALADDGISSLESLYPSAAGPSSSSSTAATAPSGSSTGVRQSRATNQQLLGTAHPLSAPPLSREDSSMEIEVDSLLTLAQQEQQGAAGTVRPEAEKTNGQPVDDDVEMTGRAEEGKGALAAPGAFEGDSVSGELSATDLNVVRVRKEIRDHIVHGRIKLAIELLNTQFPTVLNAPEGGTATRSSAKAQQRDRTERRPAQSASSRSRERGDDKGEDIIKVLPSNPTSLDPAHLSLNLQIQVFIESVRSVSAGSTGSINGLDRPSVGLTAHSVASSQPGIASAAAISRSASPAPSSTSSHESIASANGLSSASNSTTIVNPVLNAALAHAQLLYTSVQTLPGFWRSMYLKELETVTALLAYRDLESSPLRKYLDQSRRVALAEQINSAILCESTHTSASARLACLACLN
ncbi:hypothetical protein L7F22_029418 [Adiantum nelumboides]|nr:hypothetical protein [Adiantum nelumboides]